ncbi:MAG: peptidylprolyl isomerase [Proteobacteria bacterium]|nr:peptidylprolyl isomerase [Pseudomonadota bacterium]
MAAAIFAFAVPAVAQEQRIVAVVNDDIVSNFDIDGRIALILMSTNANDTPETRARMRPQILRQLIDERIQMQESKRLGLTIAKTEVEEAVKRLEKANNLPSGGLDQILRRAGVPRSAIERQIEAAIAWQRLVTGRLRSQIEVSRDEIDESLAQYTKGDPVTEYQLSEIFVAIDNPEQEDETRRVVDEVFDRIRTGSLPFFVAAQQFSQSASAAEGGDIGWVQRGQFDPETEEVLAQLEPGQMAKPIRTPSGFYIYGMSNKRVLAPASPDDARVDIAQIVFPYPDNATPADRSSVQALAETVRETVQGCADLDRVAGEMRVSPPVRVPDVRIGDLAAATRDRIRPLKVGEATDLTPTEGGIGMAMVCIRTEPQSNLPTAADIEDNLVRQRLDNAARRYLRDLRRVAVVDIRA